MNRDTQFAGFAALLLKELDDAIDKEADRVEQGDETQTHQELAKMLGEIIARRAYDLVAHTLSIVPALMIAVPDAQHLHQVMPHVPDMPALPKEPRQ